MADNMGARRRRIFDESLSEKVRITEAKKYLKDLFESRCRYSLNNTSKEESL